MIVEDSDEDMDNNHDVAGVMLRFIPNASAEGRLAVQPGVYVVTVKGIAHKLMID